MPRGLGDEHFVDLAPFEKHQQRGDDDEVKDLREDALDAIRHHHGNQPAASTMNNAPPRKSAFSAM